MIATDVESVGRIRSRNQNLILEAAEYVFSSHGYGGGSLQMIADCACLPKANIVYYFGSKEKLYHAVLERIVGLWESCLDYATAESDPAVVLGSYVREKMELSRCYPQASRIFSGEMIQGAPRLEDYFWNEMRAWMEDRVLVIQSWIDQGKMKAVDPYHLLFHIWASTQHYADFAAQIKEMVPGQEMNEETWETAIDNVRELILTGCGLTVPAQ